MSRSPLHPEFAAVYERAQRACEGAATAHAALQKTLAETQQLIAQARRTHPIACYISRDDSSVPQLAEIERDSYQAAHEAANAIRDILNQFPLHWQIAIVKALGARTAVLAQVRKETPPVLSA